MRLLILVLVVFALVPTALAQRSGSSQGTAQPGSPPVARPGLILEEGFEGVSDGALPEGWSQQNLNFDDKVWAVQQRPDRARTGVGYAVVYWNQTRSTDDWLYTPALELEAGATYRLTFWFRPGDFGFSTTESLAVAYGTAAEADSMAHVLYNIENQPVSLYYEVSEEFTPDTSGAYHVGFYCYSVPDQYFCGIDDVSLELVPSTSTSDATSPVAFSLSEGYPNPFRSRIRFHLAVSEPGPVRVDVFDVLGRRVAVLLDETVPAGAERTLDLEANHLPAGVYTVHAQQASGHMSRRITVSR